MCVCERGVWKDIEDFACIGVYVCVCVSACVCVCVEQRGSLL